MSSSKYNLDNIEQDLASDKKRTKEFLKGKFAGFNKEERSNLVKKLNALKDRKIINQTDINTIASVRSKADFLSKYGDIGTETPIAEQVKEEINASISVEAPTVMEDPFEEEEEMVEVAGEGTIAREETSGKFRKAMKSAGEMISRVVPQLGAKKNRPSILTESGGAKHKSARVLEFETPNVNVELNDALNNMSRQEVEKNLVAEEERLQAHSTSGGPVLVKREDEVVNEPTAVVNEQPRDANAENVLTDLAFEEVGEIKQAEAQDEKEVGTELFKKQMIDALSRVESVENMSNNDKIFVITQLREALNSVSKSDYVRMSELAKEYLPDDVVSSVFEDTSVEFDTVVADLLGSMKVSEGLDKEMFGGMLMELKNHPLISEMEGEIKRNALVNSVNKMLGPYLESLDESSDTSSVADSIFSYLQESEFSDITPDTVSAAGGAGGDGGDGGDGGADILPINPDEQVPLPGVLLESDKPIKAVYHKNSVNLYLGNPPVWDKELMKEVMNSETTDEQRIKMMDCIIEKLGCTIFVFSRAGSSREELNEMLQIQFVLQRNMQRGTRVPTANVPVSSLVNMANKISGAGGSGKMPIGAVNKKDSKKDDNVAVKRPTQGAFFGPRISTKGPLRILQTDAIGAVSKAYDYGKFNPFGKERIREDVAVETVRRPVNILGTESALDPTRKNTLVPLKNIKIPKLMSMKEVQCESERN